MLRLVHETYICLERVAGAVHDPLVIPVSLTSYVKEASIRTPLKQLLPKPRVSPSILGPTQVASCGSPGLVGTAFDYLLRFALKRENPHATTKPWVAYNSLQQLKAMADNGVHPLAGAWHQAATDAIAQAEERYRAFLGGETASIELAQSCLDLAQIDALYRAGYPPENLGQPYHGIDDEILELLSVVPQEMYGPYDELWLNPTFGQLSDAVGGPMPTSSLMGASSTSRQPSTHQSRWTRGYS